MLSITTDYASATGDPSPYLRRIAAAGFSHIHWCHHWHTDFLYSQSEVDRIAEWLAEFGLRLLDLHGSAGKEKNWTSAKEYERRAGIELVQNRIDMTARLGGDAVVMHIPAEPGNAPLRRSLDELQPFAKQRGIRIAVENCGHDIAAVREVLAQYPPEFIGLCYDCGHGKLPGGADLDELESLRERLIVVHLHDNDGASDQHQLPFSGVVDWARLAGILARSSYRKCVSLESTMKMYGHLGETQFLSDAFATATRLTGMIEALRLP